MIVFNTTFHVDEDAREEFIEYILQKYIPLATKSGLLTSPRFARIYGKDNDEGFSFALEFTTETIEKLEKWNKADGINISGLLVQKFKEKIIGFSTVMHTIEY